MITKLKEIFGKTDDIVFRYPMVLTMALTAAVSAAVAIEIDHQENQFLVTKLAFAGCLGISLMFGIKMLSQRISKGFILELLGTAFLLWFYFYLPKSEKDFTEIHAFVIFPIFIFSHLLVSFSGFLNKKPELNFWQFNKNLFINIFLTAVFSGVLIGGVELAILAVDKLFDFNFENTIYPKTFLFLAISGSCFIFLLFSDKGLIQLEKDGNYPQILKFFTQFVLIPLLLIYAVILYFYSGKILAHWELPRGWVSYLILIYSVVGILALLLVHPLKEDLAKSWVKIFSKIFYYTLIPLLVLLFVAIFTRILEYGYTEPRYYVLLLAVWLASVVFYFVFYRKPNIKFIPISLFMFGLFALIFPYLNAFSVSKNSQKNELKEILVKNNLLENGKINFQKQVQDSVATEIANKFEFLNRRKEKEYLLSFIPKNYYKKFDSIFMKERFLVSSEIRSSFKNIKYNMQNKIDKNNYPQIFSVYSNQKIYDSKDYDYVINFQNNTNYAHYEFGGNTLEINNKNDMKRFDFSIIQNDKPITYNVRSFMENMLKLSKSENPINLAEIKTDFELGSFDLRVYFNDLSLDRSNNKEIINTSGAIILIKKR